MALIPLPQSRQQQAPPPAATGNPQAPTANFNGVMGAVGQLAQAGQQSEIPQDSFTAPARGMAKLGEGMQGMAHFLHQVKEATDEAADGYAVANAQAAMDMAEAEQAKAEQKLAPNEWADAMKERAELTTGALLGDEKLSRKGRKRIQELGVRWTGRAVSSTAQRGVVAMGQRAEDASFGVLEKKQTANDFDAVDRGLDDLEKNPPGYINPRRLQRFREQNQQARMRHKADVQANTALGIQSLHGTDEANKYIAGLDADNISKAKMTNAVQAQHRDTVANEVDALEDSIALGVSDPTDPAAIVTPEQIDARTAGNPNIRETVKLQLKDFLKKRRDAQAMEAARATAPEERSKILSELNSVDPTKVTDEELTAFSNRIGMLPPGYRQLPRERYQRIIRKQGSLDSAEERSALAYGEDILEKRMTTGGFGPYTHTKEKKDSKGNTIYDSHGNPETYSQFVAKDWREALKKKTDLGGMLGRYLAGKKDPTAEDVDKWMKKNLPPANALSASDDWLFNPAVAVPAPADLKRVTGPTIDPAGIMESMPSTASPLQDDDGSLIGDPYREP